MDKSSGFTLIELMIVIAIITVVSAITAPNLIRYLSGARLKSAATELQSTIQMVRLKAVKERSHVVITFDADNNSQIDDKYKAFVDDGAGGGTADNWVQDGSEETVRSVTMEPDVNMYEVIFSGQPLAVRFNSRGLPSGTGHVYFKINGKNKYMGIKVSITGRPRIVTSTTGQANSWVDY